MAFGALVGIVALFPTLVASDLIQWPEPSLTPSAIPTSSIIVLVPPVHPTVMVMKLHARMLLLLFHLWRHLMTRNGFMASFPAVVADNVCLLGLLSWILNREVKLRMHKFAVRPVRAESAEVVDAHDAPCVTMAAVGTVPTEASVVPRTIFYLRFGIDVEKWAFLVAARIKPGVKIAFRHFRHIEFVQEFTLIAFLAQAAEPVLAHDCSITFNMSERTRGSFAAVSLNVKTTYSGP